MIRKKLLITAAAFAAIVGCNKTESLQTEDYKYTLEPNEIAFRASSVGTKAFTEATATSLQSGWNCLALTSDGTTLFNTALTYEAPIYRVSGKTYYYPLGKTMDFYGCYPTSLDINAGTKSIAYSQNPDTDLIVAKKTGVSAQSEAVSMDFSHALSQVDMKVKGSDTKADYFLKNLYLSTPANGTYVFADDEWTSLGTVTEYSYYTNAGASVSTSAYQAFGSSMSFIPGAAKLRAVWECRNKGEATVIGSYDVTVDVNLQKGMHSTLNLTLPNSDAKEITLSVAVQAWNTETQDITIEEPATNLAMLDYTGAQTAASNTANCYIIRANGKYAIPLVYGNAIKNGATNVESFFTEGIAIDFEDSYGVSFNASSSPYIKDHATAKGKSIASASVLWNDGTATIDKISVSEDFLKFSVSNFSPCNALITVKDNDGTILWSWHLWMTDADLTPVTITNADGVDFNVMPCDLGWNGWAANSKSTSPYFQWGRKDPFIAIETPSSNGNIIYSNITETQEQYIAHQNPKSFYNSSSSYSWTTDKYTYFWDSKMNGYSIDQKVTKTIYDPTPAGWNVPQYNTFTAFSTSNTTVADNGRYCTTKAGTQDLYFPFSGWRDCSSGSVEDVGVRGFCWLSTPFNELYGHQLVVFRGGLGPQGSYERSFGFSVRPVLSE